MLRPRKIGINAAVRMPNDQVVPGVKVKDPKIGVQVSGEKQKISGTVSTRSGSSSLPWYDGPYRITSAFHLQTLNTKLKIMKDDINVDPMPYSEVSNPAGGLTVNIGGE